MSKNGYVTGRVDRCLDLVIFEARSHHNSTQLKYNFITFDQGKEKNPDPITQRRPMQGFTTVFVRHLAPSLT